MPRLTPIVELDDAQTELLESIIGPGIAPPPPFLMWAHSITAAPIVERLGAYCRNESVLPKRLRILSMLITGRHFGSASMWNAHYDQAIELGMPPESLDRLARHESPDFEAEDLRVFYAFAEETLDQHDVSDDTYEAARALFGEDGLIDAVVNIGNFSMGALALKIFRVPVREDLGWPFPDLAPDRAFVASVFESDPDYRM